MARPSKSNPNGSQSRPKKTPEVVSLLKQAFSIGCTDEEACIHAGIGTTTYYEWRKSDEKLSDEFTRLKNNPIMKAKKAVYDSLDTAKDAQWYLERKCRDEFSLKTTREISGPNGNPIEIDTVFEFLPVGAND